MKRTCFCALVVLIIMFTGCARIKYGPIPSRINHIYKISVIDKETKQPIPDAFLSYQIDGKQFTGTMGKAGEPLVTSLTAWGYKSGRSVTFRSRVPYIVVAPGYSVNIGKTDQSTSWHYGAPTESTIEIYIPVFKCPNCIDNTPFFNYAKSFTSTIQSKGMFNELDLKYIYTVIFQGDCYLTLDFDSTLKFNNNRMTDYDVAKYLLTSIFEIMRPSRPEFKQNYNYAFSVNTTIEDFGKGSSVWRRLKIEYYIPAYAAQAFMDRLISRQQMVNESKVFINDGKVDLRFQ